MKFFRQELSNHYYKTGLVFLFFSLFVYFVPLLAGTEADDHFGVFFIHHIITTIYFLLLLLNKKLFNSERPLGPVFACLSLALISAFALNREMIVFETTVPWFIILLCISCTNLLLYGAVPFHTPLKQVQLFLAGISFAAFAYLSIYLTPLMLLSGILSIILGISLHTFVPLLFCIYIITLVRSAAARHQQRITGFLAGIGTALLIVLVYCICWNQKVQQLNSISNRVLLHGENGLPGWVSVAQQANDDPLTATILQAPFLYATAHANGGSFFWGGLPRRNFGEKILHDPLIMTAGFFSGPVNILEEERIKIMEAMFHSRHQAEERLWSGKNLVTDHISSNTTIWPELRLSYTEKTIRVKSLERSGNNSKEAIYTFYLPEGGVVSSLSLWINGKEEKGILTTKEKATQAYNTIVGVESRDPSVVHWREGNTVSVRVFPVQRGLDRTFKVGISAPLLLKASQLSYEDIYFEGPTANNANTIHSVVFATPPQQPRFSSPFQQEKETRYTFKGAYTHDLEITMKAMPAPYNTFVFDGFEYNIAPYRPYRALSPVSDLYLDIDETWTEEEFRFILANSGDRRLFAIDHAQQPIELTVANQMEVFDTLRKNRFSLFPFHRIQHPEAALVVTKGSTIGPQFHDIQQADQYKGIQHFFADGKKIKLFHLGNQLSPYLQTLKAFRTFRYENGTVKDLQALLVAGRFDDATEDSSHVFAERSGIQFTCQPQTTLHKNQAPDHIARLFAYNYILSKGGPELLAGSDLHPELVALARKANVVTPVSSLVVLETQQDYDRFDIQASKNSLQNATLHSKGAVPEPHEWALIVAVALAVLYLRFRPAFPKFIRK